MKRKNKCKQWKAYQGLKKPTCDGGTGCARCNEKYERVKAETHGLIRLDHHMAGEPV